MRDIFIFIYLFILAVTIAQCIRQRRRRQLERQQRQQQRVVQASTTAARETAPAGRQSTRQEQAAALPAVEAALWQSLRGVMLRTGVDVIGGRDVEQGLEGSDEVARVMELSRKEYIMDHLLQQEVTQSLLNGTQQDSNNSIRLGSTRDVDTGDKIPVSPPSQKKTRNVSHGSASSTNKSRKNDKSEIRKSRRSPVKKDLSSSFATNDAHDDHANDEDDKTEASQSTVNSIHNQNTIPTPTTSNDEDEECCCPICLEPYEIGNTICSSTDGRCLHAFHKDCIVEWLMTHDDCPCCRTDYFEPNSTAAAEESTSSSPVARRVIISAT